MFVAAQTLTRSRKYAWNAVNGRSVMTEQQVEGATRLLEAARFPSPAWISTLNRI
jgi:hypothetical protein